MSTVPYTFSNATGNIPLNELDANFANVKASANSAIVVTRNAQPNITSVGTLTFLSVAGNITGGYFYGNGSQLTGIVSATTAATVTTNAQPNITSVGTLTFLSVAGNVTGSYFYGNGSQLTGVQATGIGTLASLSVTGNTTSGNVLTGGIVSATGNVTGNYFYGNGSQLTGVQATGVGTLTNLSVTGNTTSGNLSALGDVIGGNVNTGGAVSATGNIRGSYILGNGSQLTGIITSSNAALLTGNTLSSNVVSSSLTSVGILSTVSATGNITGNYIFGNGSQLTGITTSTSRANVTVYSGSLAANAAANIVATGYRGYSLYSITSNAASWVTLYTSNVAAVSDYSRSISTDPTPGSGVIAEAIGNSSGTINFTPAVVGFNNENPPTVAIPMKIVNRGNATANISVTLTLLKLEG
jgi:hypothetical protein